MANYLSPGVYSESIRSSGSPLEAVGASTGGFVGVTVRGPLNTPTLVTSWQDFINKFAYGVDSPFLANSDLAYAVYGFFQNGGTKCYIIRTSASAEGKKAAKASAKAGADFTAKDEGSWGNNLGITVKANAETATNFDITITYNGDKVEQFVNVSNTVTNADYFVNAVGASKYVTCVAGTIAVTTGSTPVAFAGGVDGIDGILDTDYENALKLFDNLDDVNLICVPGQGSSAMIEKITSYAENRGNVFAIIDGEKTLTADTAVTLAKTLNKKYSAMYYPWIKVSDPLSGKLRDCPPCGHIMGVYARTIQERGVWKAPAGVEAVVRGAVDVLSVLTKADCDKLNPANVNAIMPRANYGIVVWGARVLGSDDSMKYISDVLLNVNIKESITNGTQWAVFEPNNKLLWDRVKTTVTSYLDGLWRAGAFAGDTANKAYYVKCDEELNTDDVVKSGKLICEVGYAPNTPAEFVIFRIAHSISND